MIEGLNQPIPPEMQSSITPEESYRCSFQGDWLDYGIGGKKRIGNWVVADHGLHFMGKISLWNIGTEMGDKIRHILFKDIREVRLEGKKINIYFIKDPFRSNKISKRGISLKKTSGESSQALEQRRMEVHNIIQENLTSQNAYDFSNMR